MKLLRATSLVLVALSVTGCSLLPSPVPTGDELVDEVTVREAGIFASCVAVLPETYIYDDPDRGFLRVDHFRNTDIKTAARRIAIAPRERDANADTVVDPRIFGTPDDRGECWEVAVNRPAYSGEVAFVAFSNSSGEMGAYAFRKTSRGWQKAERVVWGNW